MTQYKYDDRSWRWPYNYLWANSQVSLELCQNLSDKLPHGSGINYAWHIARKPNRLFYASNSYDAMNEIGFYCHVYQFTAVYKYHSTNAKLFDLIRLNWHGQREYRCCGYGLRDYLTDILSI